MYFKLIEKLANLDRCHNGPEMHKAYHMLIKYYKGSKLIKINPKKKINFWSVPPYWECKTAELRELNGKIIASKKRNNLEVFSYSPNINKVVKYEELKNHLFSDPKRPNAICFYFRNQYKHWNPIWGFSIPHKKKLKLSKKSKYKVKIESVFKKNEKFIQSDFEHKGKSNKTYLFLGHFDHPSQINDGLVGCIAAYEVIKRLKKRKTRFSYKAFASVDREITHPSLFDNTITGFLIIEGLNNLSQDT